MQKLPLLLLIGLVLILSGCVKQQLNLNENVNQPAKDSREILQPEGGALKVIARTPAGTDSDFVDDSQVVKGDFAGLKIQFNNDIEEGSLAGDNFYALQGIDEKIPASISYDKSKREVSLIFKSVLSNTLPNVTVERITVVLQNIKDIHGNILEKYLYNIDIAK